MNKSNSKLVYGLVGIAIVVLVAGIVLAGGEDSNNDSGLSLQPTEQVTKSENAEGESDKGADRKPAPNISGSDVTDPNKTVSLDDFKGKPVVVQVWASWCPICNEEAPDIAAFQKENPDVAFIGVNVEDTQSDAIAYKERHGLTHEQDISDPDRKVEGQLGFTGQPNSMVIDEQGRIVQLFPGAVSKAQLEEALNKI
ncbi:MAG: TlpA family protein disulfide reductase [Solirubrobacterales bacterium]